MITETIYAMRGQEGVSGDHSHLANQENQNKGQVSTITNNQVGLHVVRRSFWSKRSACATLMHYRQNVLVSIN